VSLPRAPGQRVVVVGGGIAGLASALELAVAGVDVTVLDRASTLGGKLHQVNVNGVGIDGGPTVFTMRWIFDGLFAKAGTSLESELELHQSSIIARHAWQHNERLDLHADLHQSAKAVEDFSSKSEADRFLAFCEMAKKAYQTLEAAYIRSERPSVISMHNDIGLSGLKVLFDIGLFQSLSRSLSRYFKDPRLHQLFSRYATYCGSSPFQAPATLMLIANVEMQGVWVINGGMTALARCLERLAVQHGATIRTNAECNDILLDDGRVCGVALANGDTLEADAVIFNGDIAALRNGIVGIRDRTEFRSTRHSPASATYTTPSALSATKSATASSATPLASAYARKAFGPAEDDIDKRSLSALTLSIHGATSGFPLVHHNLFFHQDYASEFVDIFQRRRLPQKPTVYICAQDRRDDSPDNPRSTAERLLLLINAPAIGDRHGFDSSEIAACTQAGFALMARCGLTVDHRADNTVVTTPASFHQRFPATGGALYGHATHGWMSSFARHSSSSPIPGLYLAGGSVHPGPGVPMAAMSGRLAAETLMGHLGLIKQSGRVVISGGTSTR
jgi:1-hydroxycarotenoid 3,4-desaturase